MTNYERITQMSIEELAELIDNAEKALQCAPCNPKYCDGYSDNSGDVHFVHEKIKKKYCHKATVKWLESEAEQND